MSNNATGEEPAKARVFLSYSRKDGERVSILADALAKHGYRPDFDTAPYDSRKVDRGIAADEEWWARLREMIAAADTVVFAVSPDSVQSPVCNDEVRFCREIGKKLVPVLLRPINFADAPPALAALNVAISFADPTQFEQSIAALCEVLDTDLHWLREAARLTSDAVKWNTIGHPLHLLQSSGGLAHAILLLERRPPTTPPFGQVVIDYLVAAIEAELGPAIIFDDRRRVLAANSAFNSQCDLGSQIVAGVVSYASFVKLWLERYGHEGMWKYIPEQIDKILRGQEAEQVGAFSTKEQYTLEYRIEAAGASAVIVRLRDVTIQRKERQERFDEANIEAINQDLVCSVMLASMMHFRLKGSALLYKGIRRPLLPPAFGKIDAKGCSLTAREMAEFQHSVLSFNPFGMPQNPRRVDLQPIVARAVDVMAAALTRSNKLSLKVHQKLIHAVDEAALTMSVLAILTYAWRQARSSGAILVEIGPKHGGKFISASCEQDRHNESHRDIKFMDYIKHLVRSYGGYAVLGPGGPSHTTMGILFCEEPIPA